MSGRACIAVIPARYASTRLPGKPLRTLCGKPLIQHVYERARKVEIFDEVVVATDSEEICSCVEGFGGKALMTSAAHPTGTDRVAEVSTLYRAPIIVNIQGDEPLFDVHAVVGLVDRLGCEKDASVATLKYRIREPSDRVSPHVVKVVTDRRGYALYFSRSPIPYTMNGPTGGNVDSPAALCYKHIGLYAFRREFLLRYRQLPQTALEKAERLEQLRILEHGYRILVLESSEDSIGVDTEEDLERVERLLLARSKST